MDDLQAHDLPRILACNGSRLMGQGSLSADDPSQDRLEGIAAHWVATQVLRDPSAFNQASKYVDQRTPGGIVITEEMAEFVDDFTRAITTRNYAGPVEHMPEQQTDHGYGNGITVRGRADCVTYDRLGEVLYIDLLKYGWRLAEPVNDWTMFDYAIGAMIRYGFTPQVIIMTVHQPRPHHPDGKARPWTITAERAAELKIWLADKLGTLTETLATGPQCHTCPSFSVCPAAFLATMNAIDVSGERFNSDLPDAELGVILHNANRAKKQIEDAIKAYEELALFRMKNGHAIEGVYSEMGFGRDAWNQGITGATLQALTGISLAKEKLLTPTQAIKAGADPEVIKAFYSRPPTGVKLVYGSIDAKAKRILQPKE